jgi:uncharacterized cupredoxin-like copper-binding protein
MTSFTVSHSRHAVSRRISYLAACGSVAALMAGCGSASSAGPPASPGPSPTAGVAGGQVTLEEYKITVPSTMKAGNGSFHIVNSGTIEHELLVFKSTLDISKYPVDADGNISEDDPSITKVSDGANIAAGGTKDRTVDLSKPGTYAFICNLPAHYKQGMVAVITVVP